MLTLNVGKREHQKATLKLKILNAFLEEMTNKRLQQLKIEDVCKSIGISKVTFFNYYSSKEQVVEYFIALWQFEMMYMIHNNSLLGTEIIYKIFENVSEHPASLSIMNSVIIFFAKVECYRPIEVSDYEMYLYNPEAYLAGCRVTPLILIIEKALEVYEIEETEKSIVIANVVTTFYGMPLVVDIGLAKNLKSGYNHSLKQVLAKELSWKKKENS